MTQICGSSMDGGNNCRSDPLRVFVGESVLKLNFLQLGCGKRFQCNVVNIGYISVGG